MYTAAHVQKVELQKVEWQKVEQSKVRTITRQNKQKVERSKGRIFYYWEGRKFSKFVKEIPRIKQKFSKLHFSVEFSM